MVQVLVESMLKFTVCGGNPGDGKWVTCSVGLIPVAPVS
jgi:hypothetical protein